MLLKLPRLLLLLPPSAARVRAASTAVVSEVRGPVAAVTLANPGKRNALSLQTLTELESALERHSDDRSVRAVVLRSSGRVFCSGHDLRELRGCAETRRRVMQKCASVMTMMHQLPVPVIAVVSGLATAAGCQLVASCDLAVAGSSAQFATPGVKVGLFCSTPAVAVGRSVPAKSAMKMLLTGEPISAQEALAVGLVSHVTPDDQLEPVVDALVAMVTRNSRPVVALGKRTFYRQLELSRGDAYALCSDVMLENLRLPDAQEGIQAFLEKRHPNWRHTGSGVTETDE